MARAIEALGRAHDAAAAVARDPAAVEAARRGGAEPKKLCCVDVDFKTIVGQQPSPDRPPTSGPSLIERLERGAGKTSMDEALEEVE